MGPYKDMTKVSPKPQMHGSTAHMTGPKGRTGGKRKARRPASMRKY